MQIFDSCAETSAPPHISSCNSEVVSPTSTSEHVDPETGVRYTLSSVEITRDQVEEYFGEYHCSCAADSGKGNRLSRKASVGYACEYVELRTGREHPGGYSITW